MFFETFFLRQLNGVLRWLCKLCFFKRFTPYVFPPIGVRTNAGNVRALVTCAHKLYKYKIIYE